jgi:ABC-2 type transport system permease protein
MLKLDWNVIFMIINNSTFIVQWLIIFSIKSNIAGYELPDLLLLWGFSAASYGISHLLFENSYSLPELITTGKLDVYLVQPKDVLFSVAISRIKPSAIGDLIFGYVILMIIRPDLYSILLFTLFIITGGIILTAVQIIYSSLTFWIKRGDVLADNVHNTMIIVTTYPGEIFKGIIRIILYTLIPAGFMAYIPVSTMLDINIVNIVSVILVTILLVAIAYILFYRGLRRYSSGNLMSARI